MSFYSNFLHGGDSTRFLQEIISSENSTVRYMRIKATGFYTGKIEYEKFYIKMAWEANTGNSTEDFT